MRFNAGRSRAAAILAITALAALSMPGVAAAASEHFFNGGLSPQRSFASSSAHTNVYYASAFTNHTACVGSSVGWAGYSPPGSGSITGFACGINPGGGPPGGPSGDYRRGWVGNPNEATNVSVADSHYSW